MTRHVCIVVALACGAHAAVVAADSAWGSRLFESLACVQCHSVNGKGGRTGPDLGRLVDRPPYRLRSRWILPRPRETAGPRNGLHGLPQPPRVLL
jgi:cytochrome c553